MKKNRRKIITILFILVLLVSYIYDTTIKESYAKEDKNSDKLENANIIVHYLDVGQADSIFIELDDDKNMLIDAGEKDNSEDIINYINNLGYKKIDYLIATHPHADHIGGMKDVVEEFEIASIYMPKATTNTKTYENLLKAIDNKNLKIKTAKAGVNIVNNNDLNIDIIAPNSTSYDDLNNYSVCIKLIYKDVSYLFMGDAEELSENEITKDIKADVLKVGHHGSNTSSSTKFLKKVNPSYAVISVGKQNSYGHPHDEVLDRLEEINAKVYRTDLNGTIKVSTDGENIAIDTQK